MFEPRIRELLRAYPSMPATVGAARELPSAVHLGRGYDSDTADPARGRRLAARAGTVRGKSARILAHHDGPAPTPSPALGSDPLSSSGLGSQA